MNFSLNNVSKLVFLNVCDHSMAFFSFINHFLFSYFKDVGFTIARLVSLSLSHTHSHIHNTIHSGSTENP